MSRGTEYERACTNARKRGLLALRDIAKSIGLSRDAIRGYVRDLGEKPTEIVVSTHFFEPEILGKIREAHEKIHAPPVGNLAVEEAAWLAGIIDGEGSIQLNRATGSHFNRCVQVANSDSAIIGKLERLLKSRNLRFSRWIKKKRGYKDCVILSVTDSRSIIALLRTVLPFLCKKPEALILLEEAEDVIQNRKRARRDPKITARRFRAMQEAVAIRETWEGIRIETADLDFRNKMIARQRRARTAERDKA